MVMNSPYESNHSDSRSLTSLFVNSPIITPASFSASSFTSLPLINLVSISRASSLIDLTNVPSSSLFYKTSPLSSGPSTSLREIQTSIPTSSSQSHNKMVFHGMVEQSPTTMEISSLLPPFKEDSQFDEPHYILMSPESSSTSINWNQSNINYNTRSMSPSVDISIADRTMGN